ncbi:hypothetical protein [Halococcus sp. IIIV-5B]|uniref:hypothetical protein n=1 Tax=Halococcus sp. IIIV-5B TaxID=2321230 RepID=UPI0011C3B7FB|nr:hypothetical protein [Halococcus sp. IIIV-5B]
MGRTRSNADRVLLGEDRSVSARWTKLALGSLVVAGVALALGQTLSITASGDPTGVLEILHGYVGLALLVVALAAVIAGLLAGAIHAYLNDGLVVSLALAPVVGLAIGYLVGGQVLFTVARNEWAALEGGLYVFLVSGLFVLLLGVVGFVVGAGGRRARGLLARQ